MRSLFIAVLGLVFVPGLMGQTPPAGATDITQMPPAAAASTATAAAGESAPSIQVAAPASVLRIYVDTLSGADAGAIASLITQAMFEAKTIVVTENQNNASLILKGDVVREAIPHTATSRRTEKRPAAGSGAGDGDGAGMNADAADTETAQAAEAGLDLLAPGSLGDMAAPVDLSRYRYRLELQLVNPDGDLVWMNGRGRQALPYQDADDAVQRTVAPMLQAVAALTPARP